MSGAGVARKGKTEPRRQHGCLVKTDPGTGVRYIVHDASARSESAIQRDPGWLSKRFTVVAFFSQRHLGFSCGYPYRRGTLESVDLDADSALSISHRRELRLAGIHKRHYTFRRLEVSAAPVAPSGHLNSRL
jgi:hypothetical protein